jgi:hypothetical protein
MMAPMTPRIIAIDWSGAVDGSESKIWLAEAQGGQLTRLECGRTRDRIAQHLIDESPQTPDMVVGLDFAFGLPQWFLDERGLATGPELWDLVAEHGEGWLMQCAHPFWGRPGRGKPSLPDDLRKTDRDAPATGGIRPKSVFQIGGAGAVGTGSLRGMPVLKRLRDAGFAIWPFDEPRGPTVIEIYPRLLTGVVKKADAASRVEYLERSYPGMEPSMLQRAASSEDAFDAAVSALVMEAHADELVPLPMPDDIQLRREGLIWAPRDERVSPKTTTVETTAVPVRRRFDSSRTRVAPVFNALRDQGKPKWISALLDMAAENGPSRESTWRGLDLSLRNHYWGKNEQGIQPPVSLLSWLIRNPAAAGEDSPAGIGPTSTKRQKLWEGDPDTVAEALALLRTPQSSPRPVTWHILEGPTCPDAYLVTPDALIVVEGKRTEAGPTTDTTWMRGRHQMLRHIDAAWEIRGRRDVFGFFLVEADPSEDPVNVPARWRDAASDTISPEAIARSLPHRGPEERAGIARSFVGVTTWQAIVQRFGLDAARVPPRDITELQEA